MARPKTYRSIDAPAKQPWRPFHAAGMERGGLSVGKGAKEMNMIDAATNPNGAAARYINLQQPDLQRKNKLDLQGMVNQGGLDRQRLMNHGQMGVQGLVNQGGLARQGLMNQGQLNTQLAVNSGQLLRQRLVNQGAMERGLLSESGLDSRLGRQLEFNKNTNIENRKSSERLGMYEADRDVFEKMSTNIWDDQSLTPEQKMKMTGDLEKQMFWSGSGGGGIDRKSLLEEAGGGKKSKTNPTSKKIVNKKSFLQDALDVETPRAVPGYNWLKDRISTAQKWYSRRGF